MDICFIFSKYHFIFSLITFFSRFNLLDFYLTFYTNFTIRERADGVYLVFHIYTFPGRHYADKICYTAYRMMRRGCWETARLSILGWVTSFVVISLLQTLPVSQAATSTCPNCLQRVGVKWCTGDPLRMFSPGGGGVHDGPCWTRDSIFFPFHDSAHNSVVMAVVGPYSKAMGLLNSCFLKKNLFR